jgi:mono/diheme cytochrome c family protein
MKRRSIPALAATALVAVAATSFFASQARETKPSAKSVTFTKDVAPILFKNCAECHRPGEAAPMSLLSYADARPWAKSIREKVASREMPPWHAGPHSAEFKNDRRLSQAEIDTILAWIDSGAEEGAAEDLPPAPKFADGWSIGQPDVVLQMPEEYTLETSGADEYQYFEIPTNFGEDRYVQAIEARPGNRKIVHHIVAFLAEPSDEPQLSKEDAAKLRAKMEQESIRYRDGFLRRVKADAPVTNDACQLPNGGAGWSLDTSRRDDLTNDLVVYAPGREPDVWEPGVVKRIPAGAKIILQVHYSKVAGIVQKDRSGIGMIFAKGKPTAEIVSQTIFNAYFQIPPGVGRHRATACWIAPEDIRVLALMPHMHVRGSAMEIKVVYPDGSGKVLLDVPKYDFSWQTNYSLKQPLTVPKGSRLIVTGTFDNSAKNKYNPDPTKAVRWGDPTYDEMLVCFVDYLPERRGK